MQLSLLVDELTPFLAMEVMERGLALEAKGHDVVQLAVGQPDGQPPPEVVQETIRALSAGETQYTESRGLPALCEAIAHECSERRGVSISPEQVIVTTGTSPGLFMTLRLLLDPGDEALIPTPYYPCYPNMARTCGARPVLIETSAQDGFVIDVAALRKQLSPRTRCIVLASPANPTGAIQPPEVIDALLDLGVPLVCDEIYDGLVYDGAQVASPLGRGGEHFVLDGFSKRYAMTGYRLGYVLAPKVAVRPLQLLQQNLHISASMFAQRAGITALIRGALHVEKMQAVYCERRNLLVRGLRELGFGVAAAPRGAFYVLADARRFSADSMRLALDLLERAHVAVAPGADFGAEGHLRFSFAVDAARIREGLSRLARVL